MFEKVLDMYKANNLGKNEICHICKKEQINIDCGLSSPITPYYVGKHYEDDNFKILFVGKNARGTLYDFGENIPEIIDAREKGSEYFLEYSKPFWTYIKAISCLVLANEPEDAIERIAITNLIKCNNAMDDDGKNSDGTYNDYTTPTMMENCLNKLGVFWNELDILKPKHIIFFTHFYYDEYLNNFSNKFTLKEIHDKEFSRQNGAKRILWWDRHFYEGEKLVMRVLRTSHPQYQKKEEFVEKIANWIMQR